MTTRETAKVTGIPAELLVRMRSRTTSTLQSGPPYCKVVDRNGIPHIRYNKANVMAWLRKRNLLITAAEAASLLGVSRIDIMAITGVKRFDLKFGFIVVSPIKNRFILVLLKRRKKTPDA